MNILPAIDGCGVPHAGNQRLLYGYREMEFQATNFKISDVELRQCEQCAIRFAVTVSFPVIGKGQKGWMERCEKKRSTKDQSP